MSSSTSTQQSVLNSNSDASTRILASGPSPTLSIDCDSFSGSPLFPSSESYVCGTKTNNRSLMTTCCNGASVEDHLGCFMHCEIEDFTSSRMREFVSCLSTGGKSSAQKNASDVDPNVFCQGQVNISVTTTSSATRKHGSSSSLNLFISTFLLALVLCTAVAAECIATVEGGSSLIRQGEARSIGIGVSCSGSPYCIIDQTGTDEIVTANRTLSGRDASDRQYDDFFKSLGDSTDPPRLFAATSLIQVRRWAVGVADDNMVNHSFWAPFLHCVNATADGCANVEGTVEACGPVYQSGTGLDDDAMIQGVFLRTASPGPFS